MNLLQVTSTYSTDDECLEALEKMRWPDGVRCVTCGNDRICKVNRKRPGKNKRTRFYQCLEPTCKQQFSATNGTMFNDSHLPLTLWFAAIALIIEAKKGISSRQLQRHLGIGSYRSAWYMCHRIRKAMEPETSEKLTGIVEIDEVYIGGKTRSKVNGVIIKPRPKEAVLGLKERGGRVRFQHIPDVKAETLGDVISAHVSPDVDAVMTDEMASYPKALIHAGISGKKHHTINHSKGHFVDGMIYTNGIESHFSLLKRGIVGSFHRLSIKHLHRYLTEFEYRFNARNQPERFAGAVTNMVRAPHMPYADLIA